MKELNQPLDDDEIDLLQEFLLNRIDDDAYQEGMDEGIFDIATLDGFFTAVVSGPVLIPPSAWLPVIWGDFEPEWEDEEAFAVICTLLIRHMNNISQFLMDFPQDFEPLHYERKVDDQVYAIVDEWCEGYQMGIALATNHWRKGGEEITELLTPILAFSSVTDWLGHDLGEDEAEVVRQTIAPSVRAIHAYWLARRDEFPPSINTIIRDEPKAGRNDPCPCGSGKKYKKCCGA